MKLSVVLICKKFVGVDRPCYVVIKPSVAATRVFSESLQTVLEDCKCTAAECFLYFHQISPTVGPVAPDNYLLLTNLSNAVGLQDSSVKVRLWMVWWPLPFQTNNLSENLIQNLFNVVSLFNLFNIHSISLRITMTSAVSFILMVTFIRFLCCVRWCRVMLGGVFVQISMGGEWWCVVLRGNMDCA